MRTRKGQPVRFENFADLVLIRCVAVKTAFCFASARDLSTFSSDSSCQLDVLWHDGDPLGVDGAKICVLEETDQVSFGGFLESCDSSRLESQVGLEVLGDFTDQSLEWQLSDEQFGGFLVSSDLPKSDSSWSVTMRFLDSSSSWGTLSCGFGSQLLTWSFASSRFSGGLLGSCHFDSNSSIRRRNLL